MNPILPLQRCIPDVEARVFADGNIYLYGSTDILGQDEYCSREYYTFYSEDFVHWKRSGRLLDATTELFVNTFGNGMLYAPDCIEKDGKYYLFFCLEDGCEGVAVSESPTGPFEKPHIIKGVERDGIDPSAFVDEDGSVYYFWGQFHLRGARLSEDMRSISPDDREEYILTEEEHGFHEGASIRKRKGIYYMLYTDITSGRATRISYATADKPLGPYKKEGVIIDNVGCDPKTWNNHGSMQKIGEQWYVFYHRSSQNSKYNRRVCVEKITFDEYGKISTVQMTTSGSEDAIPADRCLEAGRCCSLAGGAYTFTEVQQGHCVYGIAGVANENFCCFDYLEFQNPEACYLTLRQAKGLEKVKLCIGDNVSTVQTYQCGGSGESHIWQEMSISISPVSGVHKAKLIFYGSKEMRLEIKDICFR